MKINPSIFKAYDIRGIYPQDINEENIKQIVKGIYTFFVRSLKKKNITIGLGRDMRVSGPSLFKIAKKTLLELGANVSDIGLVSTPTFYFSILHYGLDTGIQISASHNPKEYNGLKFVKRDGKKLIKIGASTGMNEVKNIVTSEDFIEGEKKGEVIVIKYPEKAEVDFAFKELNYPKIKKFKVVADPANAMGIIFLKELFKRLPCELIEMNFKLDGTFPVHQPDPLDFKNLVQLEKKVVETDADLGIAPDGDGDRVFFINEKGKVIKASLVTSILVKDILKNNPGEKILIDVRYTGNISNITKKYGGIPLIGKVGHALITERMIKDDVIFSGESSGHYFYRDTGYAENSVITILRLLQIMSREMKPVSELVEQVETSFESGEYNFILDPKVTSKDIFTLILSDYKNGKVTLLDGVAVDYPSWRFSIRASNTEPLIRLNVEGKNAQIVISKLKEIKQKIIAIGAKLKE